MTKQYKNLKGKEIGGFVLDEYLGAGKKGFTYKANDPVTNQKAAIKLYDKNRIVLGWENEIKKINAFLPIPEVVRYIKTEETTIDGTNYTCIFYDFIEGKDLKKYIKEEPSKIDLQFVESLLKTMLSVFFTLNKNSTFHGDIHEGNIMWSPPRADKYDDKYYKFVLIDFGLASERNTAEPKDDYRQLAIVCGRLMERIDVSTLDKVSKYKYDEIYKYFLKILKEKDKTTTKAVENPEMLIEELESILNRYSKDFLSAPNESELLDDPFDFLSADKIREDSALLRKLYSERLPTFNTINSSESIIISGPRGCGKTIILRNMRYKTKLYDPNFSPVNEKNRLIGFYIHAQQLYDVLPSYMYRRNPEFFERASLQYFYLSLMEEIFSTFDFLEMKTGKIEISEKSTENIIGFFSKYFPDFNTPPPRSRLISHLSIFVSMERRKIHGFLSTKFPSSYKRKLYPGRDFLRELCEILINNLPFLKNKHISFLLDDYSMPNVSEELQKILNRVIFYRGPEYNFKVSSEKESVVLIAGEKLLENTREFTEVDLGYEFMRIEKWETKAEFLQSIVNYRLERSKDVVHKDISIIIGKTNYSWNELARLIRDKHKLVEYYGLNVITELCSGDISVILELLKEIISDAESQGKFSLKNGSKEPPIPSDTQSRVIKDFSQRFFDNFGPPSREGSRLKEIIKSFGDLSNWYIRELTSKNEQTTPPEQCNRIEISDDGELSEQADQIYKQLLKYCGFIRVPRGRSQRGSLSKRLYFRRIFIPAFLLSFSRRDSVRWEVKDFERFLIDTERFVKEYKVRVTRKRKKDTKQKELDYGK